MNEKVTQCLKKGDVDEVAFTLRVNIKHCLHGYLPNIPVCRALVDTTTFSNQNLLIYRFLREALGQMPSLSSQSSDYFHELI